MNRKQKQAIRNICLVLTLLVAAYYYITAPREEAVIHEGELVMQVLDVGQGDSILISCGGENMLVDAGERDQKDTVISAVQSVGALKYIFVTHPHSDHMGAMADVIRACPPELFIMPEKEHTTASFEKMLDAVEETGTDAEYGCEGLTYKLGDADITVLSPEDGKKYDNLNNWSIVLLIKYNGFKILLTGDAESDVEKVYAPKVGGKIDVLKAGHHGSSTSNSEALMSQITPGYAIISCGEGNSYGHPHKETVDMFEKYNVSVFRTDLNGTVTVTINGDELNVYGER